MAAALKDFYDRPVVAGIARRIAAVHPAFPERRFVADVLAVLPPLALLDRARAICDALRAHLPDDFEAALAILLRSLEGETPSTGSDGMQGFRHLPLLNFVGAYGLAHPRPALAALNVMTRHFSAEFDIRHFLVAHYDLTMAAVQDWRHDADWRVRRLCSEGLRPRLPWGIRLQRFVADPAPVLAILDGLYADPNEIVRRSVANNLNDISRDHPPLAAATAARWLQAAPETARDTVRHGMRTLVKRGDAGVLKLLGFDHAAPVSASGLALARKRLRVGDTLEFSLTLRNDGRRAATLSVDYAIHWMTARGVPSRKVFKLAKPKLAPGAEVALAKRHALKPISTRRYYPGAHRVEVLVNGRCVAEATFSLAVT